MAGRGMMLRLQSLERRDAPRITRYHWIVGKPGETIEDAKARYEREQGPIGATEGVLIWNQFTDNGRVPTCA